MLRTLAIDGKCATKVATKSEQKIFQNRVVRADSDSAPWQKKGYAPQVSVVVPIYEKEDYLEQTINSICEQVDVDFEIIAVDDMGKDKSIDILQRLMRLDNRVKYVCNIENRQLYHARQIGIKFASGKYILNIDSDDVMMPGTLAHLVDIAENEQSDLVQFGMFRFENENELNFREPYKPSILPQIPRDCDEAVTLFLARRINFSVCNKMVKRSLWEQMQKVAPKFDDFSLLEDLPQTATYCAIANKYSFTDRLCYGYRIVENSNSLDKSQWLNRSVTTSDMLVKLSEIYEKLGLMEKIQHRWGFFSSSVLEQYVTRPLLANVNMGNRNQLRQLIKHADNNRQLMPVVGFRSNDSQDLMKYMPRYNRLSLGDAKTIAFLPVTSYPELNDAYDLLHDMGRTVGYDTCIVPMSGFQVMKSEEKPFLALPNCVGFASTPKIFFRRIMQYEFALFTAYKHAAILPEIEKFSARGIDFGVLCPNYSNEKSLFSGNPVSDFNKIVRHWEAYHNPVFLSRSVILKSIRSLKGPDDFFYGMFGKMVFASFANSFLALPFETSKMKPRHYPSLFPDAVTRSISSVADVRHFLGSFIRRFENNEVLLDTLSLKYFSMQKTLEEISIKDPVFMSNLILSMGTQGSSKVVDDLFKQFLGLVELGESNAYLKM